MKISQVLHMRSYLAMGLSGRLQRILISARLDASFRESRGPMVYKEAVQGGLGFEG